MLSVAERALAVEHQRAVSGLTDVVQREVSNLVMGLSGQAPAVVREALKDLVPDVAVKYGDAAAALAMDYYEFAREAAEVPGMFIPTPAALPPPERFDQSIRWAVGSIVGEDPTFKGLAARLGGSISRAVTDVATDTLVGATHSDGRARGWSRILEPGACPFCRMLSDRGAVYRSSTVRFASHDNCRCSVAPEFAVGRDDREVSEVPYVASRRTSSDADRKRVRDYLAANYPTG